MHKRSKDKHDWQEAPEVFLKSTSSTNAYAREWLQYDRPHEGTIIRAGYQEAGRGQRGRDWKNSAGCGFLISVILYPVFLPPEDHFLLNMAFTLAGLYTAQAICPNPSELKLKWPNDIYHGNRKLAGTLLETSVKSEQFSWCIAGCGMNVLQDETTSQEYNATSLEEISGKSTSPSKLTLPFRKNLAALYNRLKSSEMHSILTAYQKHLIGVSETVSIYEPGTGTYEGKIQQVFSDGSMDVYSSDTQSIHRIKAGQERITLQTQT